MHPDVQAMQNLSPAASVAEREYALADTKYERVLMGLLGHTPHYISKLQLSTRCICPQAVYVSATLLPTLLGLSQAGIRVSGDDIYLTRPRSEDYLGLKE